MSEKNGTKKVGVCPSCHTRSNFEFIGIQEWNPEIAKKLNLPTRFALYRCENCDSSVNEFALRDDSATAS